MSWRAYPKVDSNTKAELKHLNTSIIAGSLSSLRIDPYRKGCVLVLGDLQSETGHTQMLGHGYLKSYLFNLANSNERCRYGQKENV